MPQPTAASVAACVTFPETGKQVCGAFIACWDEHGYPTQQGLPLTDLFLETNPTDGKRYPNQYFERARFEYQKDILGQGERRAGWRRSWK